MVHHGMPSRRGGTCDDSSRSTDLYSHNSASPTSSAENPCLFSVASHYLNTKSVRGRAYLNCSKRDKAAMRTATFPLPPNHVPHTTQFWFWSSMNCPVIVATISICISEEPEPHIPMTTSLEERNRAGPSQHRDNTDKLNGNGGRNRRHGKAIAGSSHDASGIPSDMRAVDIRLENTLCQQDSDGSREGDRQAKGRGGADNLDDWACPVVDISMDVLALEDLAPYVTLNRWQFT